jgi:2-oxoisovalerate dehydrogenase E1 component
LPTGWWPRALPPAKRWDAVEAAAEKAVERATEFALSSPMPDPAELEKDVYVLDPPTPAQIEAEQRLRQRVRGEEGLPTRFYWEAVRDALREELLRDPGVFVMGEDVGIYGGAYGATRGLAQEFGDRRVFDTPISEALIGGMAVGAAMTGMRPVAELMYVDFTPLAMDQIANQGAKNRYMFGGKTRVPMVIRTEGGAGRSIAAHHSQSLEALWTHFPGHLCGDAVYAL